MDVYDAVMFTLFISGAAVLFVGYIAHKAEGSEEAGSLITGIGLTVLGSMGLLFGAIVSSIMQGV